jgi:GNAT superfamily N-acetyltransferase
VNIIHDKQGEGYHVTLDDSADTHYFKIKHHGIPVGQVICHFDGSVLHLDDIHINDEVVNQAGGVIINYRGRGIGTAMIQFLIRYAKGKAVKRIEGQIKRFDFKNATDLLERYRRWGFEVLMTDQKTTTPVTRI